MDQINKLLKRVWHWFTVPKPSTLVIENQDSLPSPPTAEEARKAFRRALTDSVAEGWTIEIENEYDAVVSKKPRFRWVGKLILFLLLLVFFAPLALFYLIVVIVQGVTAKPQRVRVWIDEGGRVQQG